MRIGINIHGCQPNSERAIYVLKSACCGGLRWLLTKGILLKIANGNTDELSTDS